MLSPLPASPEGRRWRYPCHSLIELGLLEVVGSPLTGLEVRTRGSRIAADLRAESREAAEIPRVVVAAAGSSGYTDSSRADRNGGAASGPGSSGYTDNGCGTKKPVVEPGPGEVEAFEDTVRALQKLEFPRKEALSRARKALERFQGRSEKPTAEALVKEAFRGAG